MPDRPAAERRSTGSPELDAHISSLLDAIPLPQGDRDARLNNRDQLREILTSAARMALDSAEGRADRLDLKIANAALAEMRDGYLTLGPYRGVRKVTIFGSARTAVTDPLYDLTKQLAHAFAQKDWMVITGAGPGIMAAGLEGAGRDKAIGVSIRLPFESEANEHVDPERLVDMRYFFTRKLALMRESDAFVVMPGGFGTLDEAFELLTLLQTGKANPVPVVFLGLGHGFWRAMEQFVSKVEDEGYISSGDRRLYMVTNSVDEAVNEVMKFYSNFHSIRWVGNTLIVRMQRGPSDEQLVALNEEFGTFADAKGIWRAEPFSPELAEQDHVDLQRIALVFSRRQPGKLRSLVNRINEW